jgi:Transglutaminase-like superfamily
MRLARKLASLSRREWRDMLRAQWALVRAQVRLRTRPRGGLLDRWTAGTTRATAEPAHLERAREIGDAVRRVGLYGVTRPQCLARSLAICELLEREHLPGAIVRIGIRPQASALTAHAWVEFAGEIIGDSRAHVRGYQLLATAHGAAKH